MFTIYIKSYFDSWVTDFKTWKEANKYGIEVFGPGNFEIEIE